MFLLLRNSAAFIVFRRGRMSGLILMIIREVFRSALALVVFIFKGTKPYQRTIYSTLEVIVYPQQNPMLFLYATEPSSYSRGQIQGKSSDAALF